eukprot:scaffold83417_cov20-Tisochrysis_lutea.AAC.4
MALQKRMWACSCPHECQRTLLISSLTNAGEPPAQPSTCILVLPSVIADDWTGEGYVAEPANVGSLAEENGACN